MRTITYRVVEVDAEVGGGFTIIFTETRHATTGDEHTTYELLYCFPTREAAVAEAIDLVSQ